VGARYWRYVAVAGLIALFAFALYTTLTRHGAVPGIAPGRRLPPFAAPLALGGVRGDANVATHPNDGPAGRRPACSVRGAGILNICQLYEQGPVVLALFIDAGSCPTVLSRLQALSASFPVVRFAAVAIRAPSKSVVHLIRRLGLRFPVGMDRQGVLGVLYAMESCAQVTFAYPGGIAQGTPLLEQPSLGTLRRRVGELLAGARARGWKT
jgi:hypothetical protein